MKTEKRGKYFSKKAGISYLEISIMILATFAFCYALNSEVGVVSGQYLSESQLLGLGYTKTTEGLFVPPGKGISDAIPSMETRLASCLSPTTEILVPYLKTGEYLTDEKLKEINSGGGDEMLNKKNIFSTKASITYLQIAIMILGTISFSYILGSEIGVVSGADVPTTFAGYIPNDPYYTDGNYLKCLSPNSQISISEIETKEIKDIKVGEEVLSYDFETGKLVKEVVRGVYVSQHKDYLIINNELKITGNHIVLVNNEWKAIGEAKAGDYLFGANKEKIRIEKIEKINLNVEQDFYDLDLNGKWYFAEGVLVHNSPPAAASVPTQIPPTNPTYSPGHKVYLGDNSYLEKQNSGIWKSSSQGELKNIKDSDVTEILAKDPAAITSGTATSSPGTTISGNSLMLNGEKIGRVPFAETQADFFGGSSYFLGHIAEGLMWSLFVVGAIQLIGNLAGFSQSTTSALSVAAIAGIMSGKLTTLGLVETKAFVGGAATGLGIGVGLIVAFIVFEAMYKEESKKVVSFECQPWQPPIGGKDCEKCNSDIYPCSEYRCKSLGQACQLLNAGTGNEKCAWVNPKDVNSPIMQPMESALLNKYKYTPNTVIRPPDRGVKVVNTQATDGCAKAFTPLAFGIVTNEPAQCKVDYNRTIKFDEMGYYFGDSLFAYNHTMSLRLPSPSSMNAEVPELKNDGTYNLYVRCKDANGNENNDLFVFSFCVEKGPDVTPAKIEATSISNGMPFQYKLNETDLDVYVNEPADCKWSKTDTDYKTMENKMACSQKVYEMNNQMLYTCKTKLTGLLDRQDNVFYFRCLDQPALGNSSDRNANGESYKFILKGSQPLTITDIKPNGTVSGAGTTTPVFLEITTDNGQNFGDSWCYYSLTQNEKDYIKFYETGTNKHVQRFDLSGGTYTYYVQCVDLGGNAVKNMTTFTVNIDKNSPIVARAYKDGNNLKVVTNEKSTCTYQTNNDKQCNFAIDEGTNMPYANSTEHSAEWSLAKNYYIKCRDMNDNQPLPAECSIIVNPYSVK